MIGYFDVVFMFDAVLNFFFDRNGVCNYSAHVCKFILISSQ